MQKKILAALMGLIVLQACSAVAPSSPTAESKKATVAKPVQMDPKILISDNNSGNCLACHAVPNHPELVAGNIGPPFISMKQRFPDRAKLRAIIYDEQVNNPDTIMPPFGRNKVLTPEQIDAITDYILQY